MITNLSIQNYESHADTRIEFPPGVSVIVGMSDQGKSALFRAMCWTMFNRPSGDAFMRRGTSDTQVALTLDDGQTITRRRSKSGNSYALDDEVFTAFGAEVPEAVQAALNMDRDVNVAGQIDPIFLLQASPGEVARHFNDTAGLSDIDLSLSNLQSRERAAKRQAQTLDDRAQELESKLQGYEGLDDLSAQLDAAQALEQDMTKLDGCRRALAQSISTIRRSEGQVQALQSLTAYAPELDEALVLDNELRDKRSELKRWRYAVQSYREAQERVGELEQEAALAPEVAECEQIQGRIDELRRQWNEWDKRAGIVFDAKTQVGEAESELQRLEQQWHDIAPDVCPLCEGAGKLK